MTLLKNPSPTLTTFPPNTTIILSKWEKSIPTEKEDPPKKKLQNIKNNEFQSLQPIEKELSEQRKIVPTSSVPVFEPISPNITPPEIESDEVKAKEKAGKAKPIEEVKWIEEEVKPIQIEETKSAKTIAIKKSIFIEIIKVISFFY